MLKRLAGVTLLVAALTLGSLGFGGLDQAAHARTNPYSVQAQRTEAAPRTQPASKQSFSDRLRASLTKWLADARVRQTNPRPTPPAAPTTTAPPRVTPAPAPTTTAPPRVTPTTVPTTSTTSAPFDPATPITDENEDTNPVAPTPDPDLLTDAEVKSIIGMSATIQGGRQFFEKQENLRQYASRITASSGYYTIAMHGPTPENVRIGGTRYTAKQWAQVIKADPNWKKQNLKFVTCNIGSDPEGFAQQLSDLLGVKVLAADTLVWMNSSGKYWATDETTDARGVKRPVTPYNGRWILFSPRGR